MSDTQQHEEHSSPIKTPKQLITIIVLALVVPIIIIIWLPQAMHLWLAQMR